jgi:transposase
MRIISILAACAMFGGAVWAQAAVEDIDGDGIYSMEDGAVDEKSLLRRPCAYVRVGATETGGERPYAADERALVAQGTAGISAIEETLLGLPLLGPRLLFDNQRCYHRRHRTGVPRAITSLILPASAKVLSKKADLTRQLQTMPGVGPLTSLAIEAFAPPMDCFKCGRDFSAWLGLVPRQRSSGGRARLGRISKAGQADIRRLLIIGAMTRLNWLGQKSIRPGSWLARMLERKPRMLVAIALANKMARAIWAMITKNEDYRDPTQAAAA